MDFPTRLAMFVTLLTNLYNDHYAADGLTPPAISAEAGSKNVKIVLTEQGRNSNGSRSVYCFIDKATGDILKSASWKAPVKGARGNIYNDNCDVGTKADIHGRGLYK